jgi:CzcA family heavy metal efflux pump
MRWIVDSSLKIRVPIVIIAVALLFLGYNDVRDMPVDTLPEFGPTTVEIQTEALGLSAAEVEQLITIPMEQDLLNGVAWLDVIHSKSVPGLSSIELTFEPGTDPFRARLAVQERVSQAKVALPGVSTPPQMLQPLSSTNRVMIVGVSSSELSPIEMSVLARWTLRPRLMGVPGVANVSIWGQRERQLQVLVDPAQLRDRGVSLSQVVETSANALWVSPLTYVEASSPGTSGFIDTANQRIGIQHILPISSPDDLAQVNVEETNLQLGDVAQVVEDHQPLIGDAVLNNRPGLLLVIEKFPEASTLDTSRGVEEAIDALRPGLSGLEFDTTVFRPATSIDRGLDDLQVAALVGFVIIVLVLGLLFFQWRTALIALVVIPLSLVAAVFMLSLLGQTFNVIVLAGLVAALGLVIDDVVTDTQNIVRRLRQHRQEHGETSTASIVLESSLEIRGAFIYAGLIIVAAVVPVFFLDGLAGDFFPPIALAYLLTVLTSMAVALTVTPALSLILLSIGTPASNEPPIGRWLERNYGGVLSRLFKLPRPVFFAAIAVLMLVGILALPLLNRPSLVPSFKEDELLIQLNGPPGTSLPEMNRIANAVEGELQSIPGVRNVGGHVGRAIMSDQVVGINSGELWVTIDPSADYDATVSAIHETIDGYPGLSRSLVSYSDEKVKEGQTESAADVTVRVRGEDLGVLSDKADEVKQVLSGIDGIVDAQVDLPAEEPTVEIRVDLDAAQRHGIEPGGVRRAAAAVLQGIEVGSFFEHDKVFQVVVRGTSDTRENLSSIRDLLIDTPDGGQVALADVADVRIAPNPSVIEREAVSRRIDVTANVSGRSRGAVVRDVEQSLQRIDFPLEYHATVLKAEKENPWDHLLLFGAFAAMAAFLLLQVAFGSWRLALMAFLTLPIALIGGVLAALVAGGDVTIGTYAGFLTLLGIAARSCILLITRCQALRRKGDEPFGPEFVVSAAQERIVPVLMTAFAVGLGLLVLVLLGDPFGDEVLQPMALVILGGLVTLTLYSLFILPGLYLRFAPEPETVPARSNLNISQKEASAS